MEKENNIYEQTTAEGEEIAGEADRLKNYDFPSEVSTEVIGADIAGKTIVDIGAGDNTTLATYIREHGGQYLPVDVRTESVKSQLEADSGIWPVVGSIKDLPLRDASINISHTRFVMPWLPIDQREEAIREVSRVTNERMLVLDYDWGVAHSNNKAADNYLGLASEILKRIGFDPSYGSGVRVELEKILQLPVAEQRFHRDAGPYYSEIFDKTKPLAFMARKIGAEDMATAIEEADTTLRHELAKNLPNSILFSPPDIVVATISKS